MAEVTRAEVEAIRRCDWRGLAQVEVLLQYIKQLEPREWHLGDRERFRDVPEVVITKTCPEGAWVRWFDAAGCQHDQFARFPPPGELQPCEGIIAKADKSDPEQIAATPTEEWKPQLGNHVWFAPDPSRWYDTLPAGAATIEAPPNAEGQYLVALRGESYWAYRSELHPPRPATTPTQPQEKAQGDVCEPESPSGPESLYGRVKALEIQVAAIKERETESWRPVSTVINALSAQVQKLASDVESLASDTYTSGKLEIHRRAIEELRDRFTALEQRAANAETRLDEIAEWIAGQQRGKLYAGSNAPIGKQP